jgi:hypothetical protein
MNGDEIETTPGLTGSSPAGLGLLKSSKKRKPKRSSLLDKAAERGQLGYSPYPTSGSEANVNNNIQEV